MKWRLLLCRVVWALALCGAASSALAQSSEGEGEAKKDGEQYVDFDHSFVVNFMSEGKKAGILKVEISLFVKDEAGAEAVKLHMPYLRSALILFFSAQHEENLNTVEAKEALRKAALAEVQKILSEQTGLPQAEDLVFTGFVVQS